MFQSAAGLDCFVALRAKLNFSPTPALKVKQHIHFYTPFYDHLRHAPQAESFILLPCATYAPYGSPIAERRRISRCTAAMFRQMERGLLRPLEVL